MLQFSSLAQRRVQPPPVQLPIEQVDPASQVISQSPLAQLEILQVAPFSHVAAHSPPVQLPIVQLVPPPEQSVTHPPPEHDPIWQSPASHSSEHPPPWQFPMTQVFPEHTPAQILAPHVASQLASAGHVNSQSLLPQSKLHVCPSWHLQETQSTNSTVVAFGLAFVAELLGLAF